MNRLSIPHDALVFVGDGQKALFLRNAGDATLLNLTSEQVFTDENPPTHEQGTDRPGRAFQSAAKNKRSGLETTGQRRAGFTAWRRVEQGACRPRPPGLAGRRGARLSLIKH